MILTHTGLFTDAYFNRSRKKKKQMKKKKMKKKDSKQMRLGGSKQNAAFSVPLVIFCHGLHKMERVFN